MKKILIHLLCVFCLQFGVQANSNSSTISPELYQVTHGKSISIYYYKADQNNYTCTYEKLGKSKIIMTIVKDGNQQIQVTRNGQDAPTWAIGKSDNYESITVKAINGLEKDLQIILGLQKNHLKAQPMMWDLPEPGSGNFDNGRPPLQIVGWVIKPGIGADQPCFFTKKCSCNKESIQLTCPCMTVGLCKNVGIRVCDYNDAGAEENCRMVDSCMGYCQ